MISGSGTSTRDALLGTLNDPQRAAVERTEGPVLIFAGAGSGKTRVLTHRIAWLVRGLGVPPREILAFTFTNKAAGEMKERVERLLGGAAPGMWIGTFHATCVRILRASGKHRGLPDGFTIYDTEDQERLIKAVVADLNLGDEGFRPGAVRTKISKAKNRMLTPEAWVATGLNFHDETVARIYAEYQKRLRRARALDFDDLIIETVWLLAENDAVREQYASRFRYVHVDEYQDTNGPQYQLIRHLASVHRNLCVVGDDDQSIYGWRGADIGNILSFEKTFPEAFVVRLEQNYRSTGNILKAANAVVKNNRRRKEKTLWTGRPEGASIRFTLVADEEEEGRLITGELAALRREGHSSKELAVLYRTNAQSRAIENELRRAAIAYELVGGTPFYQRREVKDLLAYLRLAVNDADDLAFRRVLNVPKRGIGKTTLDRLAAFAFREGITLMAAARRVAEETDISLGGRDRVLSFVALVDGLRKRLGDPVGETLAGLVEALDFGAHLKTDDPETADDRVENVQELIVDARRFAERVEEPTVSAFLNEVALLTDADRMDETAERVRLLTAHNAKGLEFDVVFVAGLEEGLMPHASSALDEEEMEEERRLFYVALTRARDEVRLSAATDRRRFWQGGAGGLSRFLAEIPPELVEERESPFGSARRRYSGGGQAHGAGRVSGGYGSAGRGPHGESAAVPGYRHVLGRVIHRQFGRGEVIGREGEGPRAKLKVLFPGGICKTIMEQYVQWEESDIDF